MNRPSDAPFIRLWDNWECEGGLSPEQMIAAMRRVGFKYPEGCGTLYTKWRFIQRPQKQRLRVVLAALVKEQAAAAHKDAPTSVVTPTGAPACSPSA